jgi:hypothetical protein
MPVDHIGDSHDPHIDIKHELEEIMGVLPQDSPWVRYGVRNGSWGVIGGGNKFQSFFEPHNAGLLNKLLVLAAVDMGILSGGGVVPDITAYTRAFPLLHDWSTGPAGNEGENVREALRAFYIRMFWKFLEKHALTEYATRQKHKPMKRPGESASFEDITAFLDKIRHKTPLRDIHPNTECPNPAMEGMTTTLYTDNANTKTDAHPMDVMFREMVRQCGGNPETIKDAVRYYNQQWLQWGMDGFPRGDGDCEISSDKTLTLLEWAVFWSMQRDKRHLDRPSYGNGLIESMPQWVRMRATEAMKTDPNMYRISCLPNHSMVLPSMEERYDIACIDAITKKLRDPSTSIHERERLLKEVNDPQKGYIVQIQRRLQLKDDDVERRHLAMLRQRILREANKDTDEHHDYSPWLTLPDSIPPSSADNPKSLEDFVAKSDKLAEQRNQARTDPVGAGIKSMLVRGGGDGYDLSAVPSTGPAAAPMASSFRTPETDDSIMRYVGGGGARKPSNATPTADSILGVLERGPSSSSTKTTHTAPSESSTMTSEELRKAIEELQKQAGDQVSIVYNSNNEEDEGILDKLSEEQKNTILSESLIMSAGLSSGSSSSSTFEQTRLYPNVSDFVVDQARHRPSIFNSMLYSKIARKVWLKWKQGGFYSLSFLNSHESSVVVYVVLEAILEDPDFGNNKEFNPSQYFSSLGSRQKALDGWFKRGIVAASKDEFEDFCDDDFSGGKPSQNSAAMLSLGGGAHHGAGFPSSVFFEDWPRRILGLPPTWRRLITLQILLGAALEDAASVVLSRKSGKSALNNDGDFMGIFLFYKLLARSIASAGLRLYDVSRVWCKEIDTRQESAQSSIGVLCSRLDEMLNPSSNNLASIWKNVHSRMFSNNVHKDVARVFSSYSKRIDSRVNAEAKPALKEYVRSWDGGRQTAHRQIKHSCYCSRFKSPEHQWRCYVGYMTHFMGALRPTGWFDHFIKNASGIFSVGETPVDAGNVTQGTMISAQTSPHVWIVGQKGDSNTVSFSNKQGTVPPGTKVYEVHIEGASGGQPFFQDTAIPPLFVPLGDSPEWEDSTVGGENIQIIPNPAIAQSTTRDDVVVEEGGGNNNMGVFLPHNRDVWDLDGIMTSPSVTVVVSPEKADRDGTEFLDQLSAEGRQGISLMVRDRALDNIDTELPTKLESMWREWNDVDPQPPYGRSHTTFIREIVRPCMEKVLDEILSPFERATMTLSEIKTKQHSKVVECVARSIQERISRHTYPTEELTQKMRERGEVIIKVASETVFGSIEAATDNVHKTLGRLASVYSPDERVQLKIEVRQDDGGRGWETVVTSKGAIQRAL